MASYGSKGRTLTSITVDTETTIVPAGAANVLRNLYSLRITNSSATAVVVAIRDATAGVIIDYLAVPAGQTAGWMASSDDPMDQTTKANNWTAQSSAAVSTLRVLAQWVEKTIP